MKKARKDAKIRQDAAAEKMEMSRPTLSAIEADKRLVWAEEITKFAEMYKVSAYELLYGFSDELPEIEIREAMDDQNVRLMKYSQLYVQETYFRNDGRSFSKAKHIRTCNWL
ncbi:XRE family transcriptional regulator [Coprococcus sp. AM25-15LB]|nr:helix-turn-helix transcriptional regulator [Faecalimonas umbilicata]MDY2761808.1 helix-turn-helix transcriptional regulator [Faecalimonas umbilicata]RGC74542.1 XRE family transcriptional regulator [Coprococcus sp. AM25-15LB]RJW07075.1 XRE family transcriptional regulator [Coprococcus sp. AM25-4LB]